ncbi:AbrB/MazE/SpoVT family DNA-binding domain-containing protein [Candidatus Bathyarchaeota archaeon]|nr:AbrB/MazE/SpoVT family DNA-binding domain-containing protein [Candidatus Bathyarchaeota archaeon]
MVEITSSEELRKIQVTGGSTYIISLPKTWVDQLGLKRGSVVSISQRDDLSLSIQPKSSETTEKARKVIINVTEEDTADRVIRRVVSSYLLGYNIIQIRSHQKRLDSNIRLNVKDFTRKKLVGTEILSDLPNDLTLQILLSYTELSILDALRRMSIIAASMHRDALAALNSDNPKIAREIISMDDEVDRFNLYVIRLLKAAITDGHILRESKIDSPRQCLGYRLITKSVERMADHAVKIAENRLALNLIPLNEDIIKELNKASESALKVFEDSMDALFENKYASADRTIDLAETTRNMEQELIQMITKKANLEEIPALRLIVDSILRTAEYGSDIAETVLNMTIKEAVIEA